MTGIICLNKPQGITSFLAVAKTRRIVGEKKAGHTGTLDPMATGVLPIMLGGATRFLELLPSSQKGYRAKFKLGITTDTLDITGKIKSTSEVVSTKDDVLSALDSFRGEIMQLPPMYSAISKDGVRLYELARKGIEVEREKRPTTIYKLELLSADDENYEYEIDVECSAGTYVRTLISDIGEKLGCGAVMTQLYRTSANGFSLDDCVTLEQLEEIVQSGRLEETIKSVDSTLAAYGELVVTDAQAKRFSNGGALAIDRIGECKAIGLYRVYSPEKEFLGVGEIKEEALELSVKRVFVPR
ncbi:MAG: tRNA pseudouridine(55) synthase TruB [Clostridia bacterium]|nr:tRNA pseudouridine(55) synthase TruB [Clostridia bacterium]